jgi:hypothetical protein
LSATFACPGSECFIGSAPAAVNKRQGRAHDERWATPQERLRLWGCCFATRELIGRREAPRFDFLLDRARTRGLLRRSRSGEDNW